MPEIQAKPVPSTLVEHIAQQIEKNAVDDKQALLIKNFFCSDELTKEKIIEVVEQNLAFNE